MNQLTSTEDIKQEILRYIDSRLREWAAYVRGSVVLGKDYPPCSTVYYLMTLGNIGRGNFEGDRVEVNLDAEEVESMVMEMHTQYAELALVLREFYLTYGQIQKKAKRLGMSVATCNNCLSTARWWLAARLTYNKPAHELVRLFKRLKRSAFKIK